MYLYFSPYRDVMSQSWFRKLFMIFGVIGIAGALATTVFVRFVGGPWTFFVPFMTVVLALAVLGPALLVALVRRGQAGHASALSFGLMFVAILLWFWGSQLGYV